MTGGGSGGVGSGGGGDSGLIYIRWQRKKAIKFGAVRRAHGVY